MNQPASITDLYSLVMYGLVVAVIAMAGFIVYLIKKSDKRMENITNKMDERQKETNDIIREHTGILQSVRTLLEHRK